MSRSAKKIDPLEIVLPLAALLVLLGAVTPHFARWLKQGTLPAFVTVPLVLLGIAVLHILRLRRANVQVFDTRPTANPAFITHAQAVVRKPDGLGSALHRIDWFQFEKLVAAIYQAEGYSVQRTGGARPDGGVDLVIERDGRKSVVQCKHWRAQVVREKELREFLMLTDTGITSGVYVTLRGYTKYTETFAQKNSIVLLREADLARSLEKLDWKNNPAIQALLDPRQKLCPRCEQPMVERTAKRGRSAGDSFWGCSTYPRCNFTLETA